MAQSRDESLQSRIELVVLACLSQEKPPSDATLGQAVQQLALPSESPEVARRQATELLAGLVRRAWVTSDEKSSRKRKAKAARRLTESGERALRIAFQLSNTPTWAEVRDQHLPAMALGIPPGSELARNLGTETALTAAVLGARYSIRDAFTPTAVCDALIADLLGMPRGELTLDRMRAHVLLRHVDRSARDIPSPGTSGYAAKVAKWIACSAVGASGEQRNKLSRALARRWVGGEAPPAWTGSTPPATSERTLPAGPTTPPPAQAMSPTGLATLPTGLATLPPAQNLLEVVRDTIPRVGADGRFGEKVYVSAIWHTIERDRKSGDLSLDHFKRWLLRANRDGWLVLARADLIGAMDAKQVNESEINDRGATFHFVLDQRNGSASSHRESHAG